MYVTDNIINSSHLSISVEICSSKFNLETNKDLTAAKSDVKHI